MKKKLFTMLSALAVLMMLAVFAVGASAVGGSDFGTAARINVNTSYTDNILEDSDKNYYKFTLSEQGTAYINFNHKNLFDTAEYWVATIYNSDTSYISSFSFHGTDTSVNTYKIGLDKGTYYLRITGGSFYEYGGYSDCFNTCAYQFSVKFSSSNYTERENKNESYESAASVSVNKQYQGSIKEDNDKDFFKFTLSQNGLIYINFQHQNLLNDNEYWVATLYNVGTQKVFSWSFFGTDTSINTCKIGLAKGTYYLRITGGNFYEYGGYSECFNTCDYKLKINFSGSNYAEKELNEDFNHATTVNLGKAYTGTINTASDKDYYKFTLSKKTTVSCTFTNKKISSDEEYYVCKVFNNSTKELNSTPVYGAKATTKINMTLSKGTYYIRITGGNFYEYGGYSDRFKTDDYTIKVAENITVPKVTSLKATQTTSTIKLSWKKASGVSGYRVYKYDAKTKKNTKIADTTATSYTVKKLKAGTAYSYTVKAYKKVGGAVYWGAGSSVLKTATAPANISKLTAKPSNTTATLTWSKVSGASGYRVYRYDNGKKTYVKIADSKSTSGKVKNLKTGTTYKFAVRAFKTVNGKNIFSTGFKTVTVTTKPATPKLKVTAGSKKATLSWNKISGATGYQVYMATSKNGKYSKIATVKKASTVKYTKTGLSKGKTCYFKVRAYKTVNGSNVFGSFSGIVSTKIK